MDQDRNQLEQAYRQTTFWAELPDHYEPLRVGQCSEPLDRFLGQRDVRGWAFISAYNPGSQPHAPAESRRRHLRLLGRLQTEARPFVGGCGVGHGSDWPPNESVLVLGIGARKAAALGREFGQNAIVIGEVGGAPHLVWCDQG